VSVPSGVKNVTLPLNKIYSYLNQDLLDEPYKSMKKKQFVQGDESDPNAKKYIALTFDDGPDKSVTPKLLNILKKEGVHATFFAIGGGAMQGADILKREIKEGHSVQSHTNTHKRLSKIGPVEVKKEWEDALVNIYLATGHIVTFLRPPYGAISPEIAQNIKATIVPYEDESKDWEGIDPKAVTKNIVEHAKDGIIVLMHDVQQVEVSALADTIKQLKEKNYEFVTVEDICGGFPLPYTQTDSVFKIGDVAVKYL
jgi:peptidoglycan/xylan/chitin deacetylase (PgdA/CDA1 family)